MGRLLRPWGPGSRHALALKSQRGRSQRARNDAAAAAGLVTHPATVLDANASAFGHKAVKPHRATFNGIRSFRMAIYAIAYEHSRDDPRRRAFLGATGNK